MVCFTCALSESFQRQQVMRGGLLVFWRLTRRDCKELEWENRACCSFMYFIRYHRPAELEIISWGKVISHICLQVAWGNLQGYLKFLLPKAPRL